MPSQALERRRTVFASGPRPNRDLSGRVVTSLAEIDRLEWDQCFPDEAERYDYLLTVEQAGITGFQWCYILVHSDGRLVGAMPAFLSQYALETTLETGKVKRWIENIRTMWPGFLTFPLACLGSPCTETGRFGCHPDVSDDERIRIFNCLLATFETYAQQRGCVLHAMKDIPQPLENRCQSAVAAHGYADLGGMPTAWMDIDFQSIDEYMARLSSATRKDMRRKLKAKDIVRIEYRTDVGHHLPRIMQLYRATRERSDWQFEELTSAYFEGVLQNMPDHSFCTLYFVEEELLAANLMVHDGSTMIDKFFCMDAARGREFNLYYLSWFTNIAYCLEHGFSRYQSGQAYYQNKVRLGSQLTQNSMYFKHTNPALQRVLKWLAPYFATDDAGAGA